MYLCRRPVTQLRKVQIVLTFEAVERRIPDVLKLEVVAMVTPEPQHQSERVPSINTEQAAHS